MTQLGISSKEFTIFKIVERKYCKPLTEYTTATESKILCAISCSDLEQSTSVVLEDYIQQDGNDAYSNKGDTQSSKDAISSDKMHNNVGSGSNSITISEETVLAHIRVTKEQAKKIEIEIMNQSHSEAWFKEHQWRITAPYFGRIRKSTSPVKLAKTITTQCQKQLIPLACSWGKDIEPIAVAAYIHST